MILDYSKLKEFVDDNFTFDEYGRKYSKWVENPVEGEIALYKRGLSVFKRLVLKTHTDQACFGKG